MRTEERWNNHVKFQHLKKFTPRLQRDLTEIPTPKDLKGEIKSTFIYGEIASGKTVRAAFIMMQELKNIYLNNLEVNTEKILFVSFPEMFAELKDTFNDTTKKESEVMKKYLEAPFLVLDDFLTTRPTEWVMDILYYLINYRYEYMLKTIITCNLSLVELEKKLGDQRITSRINRSYLVEKKLPYSK